MSDKKSLRVILTVTSVILTAIYTISCIYLYYRFMVWESGSVYESDLPAHIGLAVDDHVIYSLISLIFIALNKIGLMGAVPFILGGFALLSVIFSYLIIEETIPEFNVKWEKYKSLFLALLLNVLMPCYIRGLSDGRYIGMQSSSIWHNSTYLMMKWMGLWVILIYIRLEKKISEELTLKSYLYFTAILTLATAAKPSFFLAVTPAMLVFLIIDLVTHRVPAARLFCFASSVIPSFAVMLLQSMALYSSDTGSNSITIAPGMAMSIHTGYLIPVCILSIAFPLMILMYHIKDLKKNRLLLFTWLSAAVGFMEYYLFSEEGTRNLDGNFSWGYAFTIILIFGISLLLWLKDLRDVFWDDKKGGSQDIIKKIYLTLCGLVLAYHTYCGVLFFVRIVRGVSYMMWG